MPNYIPISEETKNLIIDLYLSGMGSTTIMKIVKIGKQKILKIIKESNNLRNRKKDDEYKDFIVENNKWIGFRKCPKCNQEIKHSSHKKFLLNRCLRNSKNSLCKKCLNSNSKGKNNPFYGKKHTKESKEKISLKKTGQASNFIVTPEYLEKLSIRLKKFWASDVGIEMKKKFSENLKKTRRDGKIKSFIRSKPEDELIKKLNENNIKVIPSYKIDTKIYDLYIPDLNLLIEYNGDYWHCNPEKYEKDYFHQVKKKSAQEIWDYDTKKLYLAKTNGYNIDIIWEKDYKKNKNIIIEIIKKYE